RAQWPHERSLVEKFKGRPFVILGVNLNGYSSAQLKQVMEAEKITWRTFINGAAITGTWNLSSTPTFYVIDQKGIIRHKWVGSPADYKRSGMPEPKTIDAALAKLIADAERYGRKGRAHRGTRG